ncbi:hypothetical protein [Streptomyces sp. NPDC051452]|uniref:hypothetical protein n=1 Tax=Streptomyces sp. NPDC051452 TaxID=3365654 RepID=UPI0037AC7F40
MDAKDAYGHGASLAAVAKWLNVPTSLITGWHDALGDQTFERADPCGLRLTRVCVHVGGEDDWRDIDDWPPATAVRP